MAGLRPLFNIAQIDRAMDAFLEQAYAEMIEKMQYIGEQFVNKARVTGNYLDDTGNLRSSIGYIIVVDGDIYDSNFKAQGDDGETGALVGLEFAGEIAEQHPEGIILIGVAGMEYAAYVEAKNYDVITGSAPSVALLKSVLNEI